MQVSKDGVRIWTRGDQMGKLGGLCGKYDHNFNNDQTTPANEELSFVSNPSAFSHSWFVSKYAAPSPPFFEAKNPCLNSTSLAKIMLLWLI